MTTKNTDAKGARPRAGYAGGQRAELEALVACLPNLPLYLVKVLPLGSFQCMFMYAIDRLGNEAYGAAMLKWLQLRSKKEVNVGQLYGTAERLIEHRFIEPTERPPPTGKGRTVIVYTVAPLGRAAITATLIMAKAALRQEKEYSNGRRGHSSRVRNERNRDRNDHAPHDRRPRQVH